MTTPGKAPSLWLRIALIVIAAIETLTALSEFSALFQEYGHTTALLIFAQRMNSVYLALAPLLACAALVFAIIGRVRHAIAALALRMALSWAADLPAVAIHGLELSADFGGAYAFVFRFVYPLTAAAALWLAWCNEKLGLATILVSLPTILKWAGVVAFTISVLKYGF